MPHLCISPPPVNPLIFIALVKTDVIQEDSNLHRCELPVETRFRLGIEAEVDELERREEMHHEVVQRRVDVDARVEREVVVLESNGAGFGTGVEERGDGEKRVEGGREVSEGREEGEDSRGEDWRRCRFGGGVREGGGEKGGRFWVILTLLGGF